MSSGDIDTCERFVDRISKRVLSPNHHFVIKVKSHLVMLYSMKENEVLLSVTYFNKHQRLKLFVAGYRCG